MSHVELPFGAMSEAPFSSSWMVSDYATGTAGRDAYGPIECQRFLHASYLPDIPLYYLVLATYVVFILGIQF